MERWIEFGVDSALELVGCIGPKRKNSIYRHKPSAGKWSSFYPKAFEVITLFGVLDIEDQDLNQDQPPKPKNQDQPNIPIPQPRQSLPPQSSSYASG